MQDHTVRALDLSVGAWVDDRGPIYSDVVVVAKLKKLLASDLSAVVGDDGVRDSKPMDDAGELPIESMRLLRNDRSVEIADDTESLSSCVSVA